MHKRVHLLCCTYNLLHVFFQRQECDRFVCTATCFLSIFSGIKSVYRHVFARSFNFQYPTFQSLSIIFTISQLAADIMSYSMYLFIFFTCMASTVALNTGLLCFTVLQYFGLLGFVRLQPYFSRMFNAVDSLCRDPSV